MASSSEPTTSPPTTIPSSFLRDPTPRPPTTTRLNFALSPVPQYANCYATIIDGALTPAECATLLRLAAASTATPTDAQPHGGTWERAMINMGSGRQALATEARNCGRIIFDSGELAARLWARIAPHVPELSGAPLQGERWCMPPARQWVTGREWQDGWGSVLHDRQVKRGERWRCTGLNERLRFLRYVGGEYFRPHCDGVYERPLEDKNGQAMPVERSFFTLHLYLNDGEEVTGDEDGDRRTPFAGIEGEPEAPLRGGATVFHGPENLFSTSFGSPEHSKRVDVVPKVGRVLVFQHRNMVHSGDDVVQGVKYTMRTDLMFTKEKQEE